MAIHGNADALIAMLKYPWAKAFPFSAEYQPDRAGEIDIRIQFRGGRFEAIDPDAGLLERFEEPCSVRHSGHRHVVDGPGGYFRHHRGQSGGAAFWNEDAMRSSAFSRPKHRPEVMRIFHTIEDDQERRLLLLGSSCENRVFRLVRFGCRIGHDALMPPAGNQPVKRCKRLHMDGNVKRAGQLHEISKLLIGPDDQNPLQRPGSRPECLAYGM